MGALTRILSETLPPGCSWLIASWGGNQTCRKIIAAATTVIIGGQNYYPTIVAEEYMSQAPPVYTRKVRRFYTRHTGIVREEINGSPLIVKELSAYFVNFPP